MKFLTNLDLTNNQLLNAALQSLATAPATPTAGRIYYDTTLLTARVWNGTAWVATDASKVADGSITLAKLASNPLDRALHTGTQAASTISNFDTAVRANPLNLLATPTGNIALGGFKITGSAEPTATGDLATKNYVDTQLQLSAAGIDAKPSVRAVAVANITLSGAQTIDTISLVAGNRVLVVGQTTASQNGVYVVAAGAWTRATDADATGEITPGALWYIEEGGAYKSTQWYCNNTGTITIGTTAITIVQFSAGATYTASLGVALVGNDFRATVKAAGGILVDINGIHLDDTYVARKRAGTMGNGTNVSFTIAHNLNSTDVIVQCREVSGGAVVFPDINVSDANNVVVTFAVAPATNSLRVTVVG